MFGRSLLVLTLFAILGFSAQEIWQRKPYLLLDTIRSFDNPASHIRVDFNKDISDFDEKGLTESYSPIPFECMDEKSDLGPRVCFSYLHSFNGIRAENIAFFFNNSGKPYLMRLEFNPEYHDAVTDWLNKQYTYQSGVPYSFPALGQTVGFWKTNAGIVGHLSEKFVSGESSILIWHPCKNYNGCY